MARRQRKVCAPGASYDPYGSIALEETRKAAAGDPDIHVLELPTDAPLEVNALQRGPTIVIQKSLPEALWKKKQVAAQVIYTRTGLLKHSVEGAARTRSVVCSRTGISSCASISRLLEVCGVI